MLWGCWAVRQAINVQPMQKNSNKTTTYSLSNNHQLINPQKSKKKWIEPSTRQHIEVEAKKQQIHIAKLKQFHPTQTLQDAACFKDCWMMSKLLQHATCCQSCGPTPYHCHLPRPSCRHGHGRQRHGTRHPVAAGRPGDAGGAGDGDGGPPDTKRERQGRF